jgi:hypothetical protein
MPTNARTATAAPSGAIQPSASPTTVQPPVQALFPVEVVFDSSEDMVAFDEASWKKTMSEVIGVAVGNVEVLEHNKCFA